MPGLVLKEPSAIEELQEIYAPSVVICATLKGKICHEHTRLVLVSHKRMKSVESDQKLAENKYTCIYDRDSTE